MHDNEINQRMPAASLDIRDRDIPRTTRSTLGSAAPVEDTICADQSRRIRAVESRLIYLTEKMNGQANRLFGRRPETTTAAQDPTVKRPDEPCALDVISNALGDLEYASNVLENVLDRFDGLA